MASVERFVADVDGDDASTEGVGDHRRGEADAAAAVDGDPLARLDGALGRDGAVGRGQPATERGRGDAGNVFGERHEVAVGVPDRDIFGERSPAGEAGLVLAIADLLVAALAFGACAAAGDERNRDPLADGRAADIAADRDDDAGELVPRHMRELFDIRVVPAPAVPVAAAEPGGFDSNDGAVGRWRRIGNRFDGDGAAELVIDDCFHGSGAKPLA